MTVNLKCNEHTRMRDQRALYSLYCCLILYKMMLRNVTTATFAGDTALLATGNNVETATNSLHIAVKNVTTWTKNERGLDEC